MEFFLNPIKLFWLFAYPTLSSYSAYIPHILQALLILPILLMLPILYILHVLHILHILHNLQSARVNSFNFQQGHEWVSEWHAYTMIGPGSDKNEALTKVKRNFLIICLNLDFHEKKSNYLLVCPQQQNIWKIFSKHILCVLYIMNYMDLWVKGPVWMDPFKLHSAHCAIV